MPSFKGYERDLLTKVTALRTAVDQLPSHPDGNSIRPVHTGTKDLISGISVAVEAYPTLTAASVVNTLMAEIIAQEENVGAAIVIFNRCVEDFNNNLQMWPHVVVNQHFTRKKIVTSFTDSAAVSSFEYKFDPQS